MYRKFKIVGGVGSFLCLNSLESPDHQAPQKFLPPYRMGSSRVWQGVTEYSCPKLGKNIYANVRSENVQKITVKVKEELGILLMLG